MPKKKKKEKSPLKRLAKYKPKIWKALKSFKLHGVAGDYSGHETLRKFQRYIWSSKGYGYHGVNYMCKPMYFPWDLFELNPEWNILPNPIGTQKQVPTLIFGRLDTGSVIFQVRIYFQDLKALGRFLRRKKFKKSYDYLNSNLASLVQYAQKDMTFCKERIEAAKERSKINKKALADFTQKGE